MLYWIIGLAVILIAVTAVAIKTFRAYSAQATYIEYLEENLFNIHVEMNQALFKLRNIDLKGAFEADDEVGDVFKNIKKIILDLNDIVPQIEETEEEYGETQE